MSHGAGKARCNSHGTTRKSARYADTANARPKKSARLSRSSHPTDLIKGGKAAPSRRAHSCRWRSAFLLSFLPSQQNPRSSFFIAIFLLQPRRLCRASDCSRIAMADTVSFVLRGLPAHRRSDGLPASNSAAVVTAELTRNKRRARGGVALLTEDSPTHSATHTSLPRRQLFPRTSTLDHCLHAPVCVCVCVPGGGNNPRRMYARSCLLELTIVSDRQQLHSFLLSGGG